MRKIVCTLVALAAILFVAPNVYADGPTDATVSAANVQPSGFSDSLQYMKRILGKQIFFDKTLSEPTGQACVSCHDPSYGFTDPDKILPVSEGVIPGRVGSRNAPTAAYQGFAPEFQETVPPAPGILPYYGGEFWDGRAHNLVEQAKAPFLNPLEMNNPSKSTVIRDLKKASYFPTFLLIYGQRVLFDVNYAYNSVADAISAYEKSPDLNKFNSKFDLFLAGKAQLNPKELQGFQIFNDFDFQNGIPGRANCSTCHSLAPDPNAPGPALTDRRYFNVGVPRNMNNPFLFLPETLNPERRNFIDIGLAGIISSPTNRGVVKVPTLRNIALTSPYMHNGSFQTLETVVHFYNTRDVAGAGWAPPEVSDNVVTGLIGNQGLSQDEEDALVAFLKTLTDNYKEQ